VSSYFAFADLQIQSPPIFTALSWARSRRSVSPTTSKSTTAPPGVSTETAMGSFLDDEATFKPLVGGIAVDGVDDEAIRGIKERKQVLGVCQE
jgi:hypothetical protein